jgi:hypothetical protein
MTGYFDMARAAQRLHKSRCCQKIGGGTARPTSTLASARGIAAFGERDVGIC